ncbi:MAG: hypothetical protein OIF55_06545 [Amphritea sp.]|nr:hypothetical protein [Amphritea sp.]
MQLPERFKVYQATAIFSMLFALLGFSYNVWRMEVTEHNSNVRTASFEILLELSQLEQMIYSLHYDKDQINGSPRRGWVKVGLVEDLSMLTSPTISAEAITLKQTWGRNWDRIETHRDSVDEVIGQIDNVRSEIKATLKTLR